MIQLQSVTYYYPNRQVPALRDVHLEIRTGDFILVAGPSGSGKSTLLRTINGLVPHFSGGTISGAIIVDGRHAIDEGPQALSHHVGFISQNPEEQTLLEEVEVELAFPLENAAIPRSEMRVRVEQVLELLDLKQVRNRPITTLSGGERQRVAIASALVLQPRILVLDEPTSQLDPDSASRILHILKTLCTDHGLTVVLAEHRLERILPFADRIVYIREGLVESYDSVRKALVHIPRLPPLLELARILEWDPPPLTVREGRQHIGNLGVIHRQHKPLDGDRSLDSRNTKDTILSVNELCFSYDNAHWAIEGVDIDLRYGENLAILGPNGSGKSTLLKCIIGLLEPAKGDVLLYGRSILGKHVVDIAREIAYLPQYPDDLLFADTVYKEFEITLRNHEMDLDDRISFMLNELDLENTAGAYPRDLSTGQRQRVALGAITITQPGVLLLDEPTRGLDGRMKDKLVQIWQGWKAAGMALILVTHDVELAALMADHILILDEGKMVNKGTVGDVLGVDSDFAPQIARLFSGSGWLTLRDALAGLKIQEEI